MVRLSFIISLLLIAFYSNAQVITTEFPEVVVEGQEFEIRYTFSSTNISDIRISNDDEKLYITNKRNPSRVQDLNKGNITFVFSAISKKIGSDIPLPILSGSVAKKSIKSKNDFIQVVPKSSLNGREKYIAILDINSNSVFQGEAIIAELKVYFSVSVQDLKGSLILKDDRISIKKLSQNNFEQSQELYKNKLYNSALIGRYEIKIDSSGQYIIPKTPITVVIRKKVKQGFITRYQDENINLFTPEIEFTAYPLPKVIPENYVGVFSELSISFETPKSILASSEAANLSISFKGTGNFSSFNYPELTQLKSSFEIFEPEENLNFDPLAYNKEGEVKLKYALVPKIQGDIETPDIYVYYFNSKREKLDSILLEGFQINVTKSDKNEVIFTPTEAETEFSVIPTSDLKDPSPNIISSLSLYILGLIIISLTALSIVFLINYKKKKVTLSLREVNLTTLGKFNASLIELKNSSNQSELANDLLEITEDYLRGKLSIDKSTFSKDKLSGFLNQELAEKSIQFLQRLEGIEFGKVSEQEIPKEEQALIIKHAELLVNEIEISL